MTDPGRAQPDEMLTLGRSTWWRWLILGLVVVVAIATAVVVAHRGQRARRSTAASGAVTPSVTVVAPSLDPRVAFVPGHSVGLDVSNSYNDLARFRYATSLVVNAQLPFTLGGPITVTDPAGRALPVTLAGLFAITDPNAALDVGHRVTRFVRGQLVALVVQFDITCATAKIILGARKPIAHIPIAGYVRTDDVPVFDSPTESSSVEAACTGHG